jgi:hypothetical protein
MAYSYKYRKYLETHTLDKCYYCDSILTITPARRTDIKTVLKIYCSCCQNAWFTSFSHKQLGQINLGIERMDCSR